MYSTWMVAVSRNKSNPTARVLHSRALRILRKRNSFLFVFDVIGSRAWSEILGARELYRNVDEFCNAVNTRFSRYIVRGERACGYFITSFERIVGDGGGAYFNNACVVPEIILLAKKKLSPIELRWEVAWDIWDERSRIIT